MTRSCVIYGPPGTGKTSSGTFLAREWFNSGAAPSDVAYLAFTKAAAKAAATKIVESEEEINPDTLRERFPLFRTIHSLAYMGLKWSRPDVRVLKTSDMKKFSESTGFEASFSVHDWEDLAEIYQRMDDHGKTHWDQALAAYALTRMGATSAGELEAARFHMSRQASEGFGGLQADVYRAFVEKYEAFKAAEGLVDFTDMLAFALTSMAPLDQTTHVVVDEAQDLCALHFSLLDRVFANARETWLIADDDQAIYKFAGASAELFLSRARRADVQIALRQTHRFGPGVVEFSGRIIRRVQDRMPKEILGVADRGGAVSSSGHFAPRAGNILLLHRHVQGCQEIARAYIDAGVPFRNERGKDPLGAANRVKAFRAMQTMVKGAKAPLASARLIVDDLLPSVFVDQAGRKVRLVVHGGKKRLDDLPGLNTNVGLDDLERLGVLTPDGSRVLRERQYGLLKHQGDLEYYDRLVENGHSLDGHRAARITTIHGSKGREADEVVVFSEMSKRCWDDPDTEHRLAYVAATRTRGGVTICDEDKVEWAGARYDYPFAEDETAGKEK